jgi:hypothetical protein
MAQHESPEAARGPERPLGVAHIAFQVASYEALGEAYRTLLQHGVRIERAMDHVNQRSIYFSDPDGNRLEIYYEMPGALALFREGRGDQSIGTSSISSAVPVAATSSLRSQSVSLERLNPWKSVRYAWLKNPHRMLSATSTRAASFTFADVRTVWRNFIAARRNMSTASNANRASRRLRQ